MMVSKQTCTLLSLGSIGCAIGRPHYSAEGLVCGTLGRLRLLMDTLDSGPVIRRLYFGCGRPEKQYHL